MDEKVKAFLEAKKRESEVKEEREKHMLLVSLGLFYKEYSPDDKWSDEYRLSEWDNEEKKTKYYKNVICDVTNEEYEKIKEFGLQKNQTGRISDIKSASDSTISTNTNGISKILSVIAWLIFIGGFIAGIIFGNVEVTKGVYYTYTDTEFSFAIAFTYWCVSFISGMLMLGFAEIISLLNDIKNK